jgi:hypothetical protein
LRRDAIPHCLCRFSGYDEIDHDNRRSGVGVSGSAPVSMFRYRLLSFLL